jgi:hypothetical protein
MGSRAGALVDGEPHGDGWYASVFVIERRKCLLLIHADTLFPVLDAYVRVARFDHLGLYVATLVVDALASEGLAARLSAHDVSHHSYREGRVVELLAGRAAALPPQEPPAGARRRGVSPDPRKAGMSPATTRCLWRAESRTGAIACVAERSIVWS